MAYAQRCPRWRKIHGLPRQPRPDHHAVGSGLAEKPQHVKAGSTHPAAAEDRDRHCRLHPCRQRGPVRATGVRLGHAAGVNVHRRHPAGASIPRGGQISTAVSVVAIRAAADLQRYADRHGTQTAADNGSRRLAEDLASRRRLSAARIQQALGSGTRNSDQRSRNPAPRRRGPPPPGWSDRRPLNKPASWGLPGAWSSSNRNARRSRRLTSAASMRSVQTRLDSVLLHQQAEGRVSVFLHPAPSVTRCAQRKRAPGWRRNGTRIVPASFGTDSYPSIPRAVPPRRGFDPNARRSSTIRRQRRITAST